MGGKGKSKGTAISGSAVILFSTQQPYKEGGDNEKEVVGFVADLWDILGLF